MIKFSSLVLIVLIAVSACSSPEEKAASYIENAKSLFQQGELDKAELEFKNALQINQNLPDALYGLAKVYERNQEWRRVYATLIKIREVNPNHVDGRIMLAQMLLASNQIDDALQDAKDVMGLAPDDARSHSLMAAVQFRLGNYETSMEEVERALELDSSSNEAILVKARVMTAQKNFSGALTLLDEAIQGNPENVSTYLMKIQVFQDVGDPEAINQVYRDLIAIFPDNMAFRHALARNYLRDEEIDLAESVLEQIVELQPSSADEKERLVSFKYQYRSADEAIALLNKYIDENPNEYGFKFKLGEIYERNNSPEEAIHVYREVIKDDKLQPSGLEARNKLALLKLRSGEIAEASELIGEVLTEDKANEDALLLRAGFKINDREFDAAIVDLRTVLRDNPESIKAHGLLGQAYAASGSTQLAIESYTKAFQINPGTPAVANSLAGILMQAKNTQQANEILLRSIREGNRSADALRLLTQVKLALGEWDEAEKLAQELKKVEGQEALSEQVLGLIYLRKDQQEEGISALKRAHELDPDNTRPVVTLVQNYIRNNKAGDAESYLKSLIAKNDNNSTAYMLLGELGILENNIDKAIANFEQAIELDPGRDLAYRSLSALYIRENRLDDAEKVIRRGIEANPDSNLLIINLASIYERRGQFDEAIATYESLLEKNPELIIAKNNLASLLTDYRGDAESHNRARQMAAEFKDSSVPQFRDTYAWAAVKSGFNIEEAIVILESVVKDNEQVGVYHYHLGEAYRKKGDADNAMASLEKAVSLERPDSDIADKARQALQQMN